jgi:chromosome segregation ATPase
MSRLEAQDNAIAAVGRTVEAIVDKLAKPFAQLDGRLDGVAARFEGVAGRMDGLEDKLQNIHRRLDELNGHLDKQDTRLEALPQAVQGPVRERIQLTETALRDRVDAIDTDLKARIEELDANTKERISANTDALRTAVLETGEMVDASDRLENLGNRLENATGRLDELANRLDKVEDGFTAQLGDLGGTLKSSLSKVEGTLNARPDTESVDSLVRRSNEESVRRIGGQLDEAMATFAELMLGGGPAPQPMVPPAPAPRQPRRNRNGRPTKAAEGKTKPTGEGDDTPAPEASDS